MTPEDMEAFREETREFDERYKVPPCLDCGAMTQQEAETKCICNGDKDDCHGCKLWPT